MLTVPFYSKHSISMKFPKKVFWFSK